MAEDIHSKEGGQKPPSFFHPHVLGIILITLAAGAITFTNASAKWASAEHHVLDILFYRNFIALLITVIFIKFTKGFEILKTDRPLDHVKRGVIGTAGVGFAFAAFSILPMANATVLLFTIPIFTALLSMPVLGEKVGPWRWTAIIIGFAGVIVAVQPSGNMSWGGIAAALGSAVFSAMVGLYLRDLGKTEPAIRTVFYFLLIGSIITGITLPFVGKLPSWDILPFLILAGLLGFFNQTLKTKAYALAPAALISPFMYTMLIWALLLDMIVWHKIPDLAVLAGAFIIIASNLFLFWREQIKKKHE